MCHVTHIKKKKLLNSPSSLCTFEHFPIGFFSEIESSEK